MKKLLAIVVVLAVIGVVIFFGFSKVVSKGVVAGVREYGPRITQTPVELEGFQLSLASGSGSLRGFEVGNPEGYNGPYAIKLNEFDVKVKPMSVLSDKIEIEEIVIDGPEIIYEGGKSLTSSNISTIMNNVQEFVGESEEETEEDTGASKKIGIKHFRFSNGVVKASSQMLGEREFVVPLPEIILDDIGQGPEGVTYAEALEIVMKAINNGVVESVTGSGKVIGEQLEGFKDEAKKKLEGFLKDFGKEKE